MIPLDVAFQYKRGKTNVRAGSAPIVKIGENMEAFLEANLNDLRPNVRRIWIRIGADGRCLRANEDGAKIDLDFAATSVDRVSQSSVFDSFAMWLWNETRSELA